MAPLESNHSWPEVTSESQLALYTDVVHEATARGVPFAVGGSLAMTVYSGLLRPSKDLDLYVAPDDKDRMIDVMHRLGLRDYYDQVPYDRGWIYRSTTDDVIVDIIWNMANRRAQVDDGWLTGGPKISVDHQTIRLIPIEEMIWSKLYVLQRERCDWPDILNLINRRAGEINWRHLLARVADDAPLLGAVLAVYAWMCPENASKIPSWLWARVRPGSRSAESGQRVALLDSPAVVGPIPEQRKWQSMLIGAMNHPAEEVVSEMQWMAEMGLEFIDLTLEPPAAIVSKVDTAAVRSALKRHNFSVVGHTAYYLPIASPFEGLRRESVDELRRCMDAFAAVGARWMNIHPDRHTPMHPRSYYIERNILSLRELLDHSKGSGVGIMIENLPGDFNTPQQLGELLNPLPELGLHLDIGHANLLVPYNMTEGILNAYGSRLRHVHLHDNKGGGADLHLALGCGNVDVPGAIQALKACGYDGTITLEVFSPDREYLRYSRDLLRRLWNATEQSVRPPLKA